MNFKHLAAIVLTALTLSTQVNATDLLLYGGQNHDEFLGCLVCNEYSGESVCNAYGQYGNEYGSNMWNEYSNRTVMNTVQRALGTNFQIVMACQF